MKLFFGSSLLLPLLVVLFSLFPAESEVTPWKTNTRLLAEVTSENHTFILAGNRTQRPDPFNDYNTYNGGWNLTSKHYWGSVGFTGAPFFIVAAVWFLVFLLTLFIICICRCCCRRESYGYSRLCYALSLIFLIFFTIAAIAGSVVLYTGNGKFTISIDDTLDYVENQAKYTSDNLKNVSNYLDTAKTVAVNSVFLPSEIQQAIDSIDKMIKSASTTLNDATSNNSKRIQTAVDNIGLSLIIIAAIMLLLAFLGFVFSIFGCSCCVYSLVIFGWIMVTVTFVLCGVFLILHVAVGDTCVSMNEWAQHPAYKTALDDILPCLDNTTAQETKRVAETVTSQLATVVNSVIANVTNIDFPPEAAPLYFNQSGPLMPYLCNPYNAADLTERKCADGEVEMSTATEAWKKYVCEVSASGICITPGRLTPAIYSQMTSAIDVTYGLYRYSPFLLSLGDCSFVRDTFTGIHTNNCPGLRLYTRWVYIGLVLVSVALMLSLIFWIIYARERRHRIYNKKMAAGF
ncbi:hypothetical protein Q3G72_026746 [Acer saccharum]|nr:hypothetical protein Q3G72_026746 [Acer saccharum]